MWCGLDVRGSNDDTRAPDSPSPGEHRDMRTARPDEEGWAKTKEECADLIVYQSAHEPPGDSIYHPTLVGPDFFHKTGGVL